MVYSISIGNTIGDKTLIRGPYKKGAKDIESFRPGGLSDFNLKIHLDPNPLPCHKGGLLLMAKT